MVSELALILNSNVDDDVDDVVRKNGLLDGGERCIMGGRELDSICFGRQAHANASGTAWRQRAEGTA